ncbi:hypothetical protein [Chryseobacterium sp. NKUCC03_KSP]|uniref:hypothetical protein n=1 Tax=Chryseobacterium sp. NKUCC03_KSP TaxID=2842125 RepID=UPI001C5B8994|nr:hypothetical protein [Chryseobacterium sp. NKUCC03_KSP]MBW3523130.1 hypothetical protein [Chryseobacterium sp. NKUCC03_KSP]
MFRVNIFLALLILSIISCKQEKQISQEIMVSEKSDSLNSKTIIEAKTPQKTFSWLGNYSCNFLRMKEESGDPRGWGMIRLKIKKDSMKFGLDTYIENFEKDVVILKQTENEIILSLKNKKDSTFVITKNNNKYFLKSNFINETVGETETYELKKE